MIQVGLLGGGNISQTHARPVEQTKGAQVVAVYGQNQEKAVRLSKLCGSRMYENFQAFLNHKPMDMVLIGSPSGLHAEQGIAAARHQLHVLVEKPLDVSLEHADALIAECEQARVKLGVFFQDRVAPGICKLKELIDAGRLGKLILVSAHVKWYRPPSYYSGSRWRGTRALDGGGALINQGIHTVDLLLWLFGPVKRVFAKTAAALHPIEVEDTAVAVLEFANGALGTLEAATSAYPGYSRQVELTGSNGTVKLDGDALVVVHLKDARDDERPSPSAVAPAVTLSAASPVVADTADHLRVFDH